MQANWPIGMMEEIESILSRHHEWPDGLDSYDAVFDSGRFFPLQRRRELEAMMRLCRSINPRTVMVIGADKGGDVFHFVKCLPTVQKVIACEIRGTPYAPLFSYYFPKVDFLFLPCGSNERQCLSEVEKMSEPIDILFIDGDKSAFKQDFEAYRSFMASDGIVFMHDICLSPENGGCSQAFEKISKSYRTDKIIDMSEFEEDRRLMPPITTAYGGWLRHWNSIPTCGVGVIYI